jgi:hypothetical protein
VTGLRQESARLVDTAITHAVSRDHVDRLDKSAREIIEPDDDRDGDTLEPAKPAERTIDRSRRPCECRVVTKPKGKR